MEKKQNKVVTFVKRYESDIIAGLIGAAIVGVVGAGVGGILLRTKYGKLAQAMSPFGPGSKTGKKLVDGLTDFMADANHIQHLVPTGVTVSNIGEGLTDLLVNECGYDATMEVSGLLVGLKK